MEWVDLDVVVFFAVWSSPCAGVAAFELGRNTNARIKTTEAAATVRTLDWKECIIASKDGALLLDRTALSNGTTSRAVPIHKFCLGRKTYVNDGLLAVASVTVSCDVPHKGRRKDYSVVRSRQ